jgi:histidinol-phosphate aminotransferase
MLGRLPAYAAGRPPSGSADLRPYKLSSNENHHDPLPGVLGAITEAALAMNRYPDPASTALVAELAERHGVPADHLALGTGSVGLLQQIVQITADAGDGRSRPTRS